MIAFTLISRIYFALIEWFEKKIKLEARDFNFLVKEILQLLVSCSKRLK